MIQERQPVSFERLTRRERRRLLFEPNAVSRRVKNEGVVYKGKVKLTHEPHFFKSGEVVKIAYSENDGFLRSYSTVAAEITKAETIQQRAARGGVDVRYQLHPTIPQDFFSRKIGRLSLDDIAKMPSVQSKDNLIDIFNFWWAINLQQLHKKDSRRLQSLLTALITQPLTHPEINFPIHARLLRIRSRFLPSFEYFKDFMLNFSSDEKVDSNMTTLSMDFVPIGLIYCYETSGLALSSIQKLAIQRRRQLNFGGFLLRPVQNFHSKIAVRALQYVREAKQINSLWDYLTYEPKIDKLAGQIIENHYQFKNGDGGKLANEYDLSHELNDKWQVFRVELFGKIRQKPIDIKLSDQPIFDSIRLLARTRESTHVVIFFKKPGVYLTLDIDSAGRLFGLPPDLAVRFPHATTIILNQVLKTLLPALEERFPQIAGFFQRQKTSLATLPEISLQQLESPITIRVQQDGLISKTPEAGKKQPEKPLKRKALRRVGLLTEQPVTLALEVQAEVSQIEPVRLVNYTEDFVRTAAGKRIASADLARIMNTIRRFEFGNIDAEALQTPQFRMTGQGAVLLKLHTGKWRVILQHHGKNVYSVLAVSKRDQVYKKLAS